jgi:hypothetical protein
LAYHYFEKALLTGVSFFEDFHKLFKDNQDVLGPLFVETKKPSQLINKESQQEVLALHEAYVNEMRSSFSAALGKDRLYKRPAGFIQD